MLSSQQQEVRKKIVPIYVCTDCGYIIEKVEYKNIRNLRGEPYRKWEKDMIWHDRETRTYDFEKKKFVGEHCGFIKAYASKEAYCWFGYTFESCSYSRHFKSCDECMYNRERWVVRAVDNKGHVLVLKLEDEKLNQKKWLEYCEECEAMKFFTKRWKLLEDEKVGVLY